MRPLLPAHSERRDQICKLHKLCYGLRRKKKSGIEAASLDGLIPSSRLGQTGAGMLGYLLKGSLYKDNVPFCLS